MSVDWPRFAELVSAHNKFLLTTHIRPDCDALGSALGMAGVLESLGKQVQIVTGHAVPPNLAFIDPQKKIKHLGSDIQADELEDIEVLLVLDTSAWIQLGDVGEVVRSTKAKKGIVDHHVSQDDLGAELFKDTSAEATGRLVVDAADHLKVKITPEMAMPLYAAIATDTGWFRFPSTTPSTYRYGARLIEAGASPSQIYHDLYEQDTLARVQLRGRVLANTKVELDGRLVHTLVSREDFETTGALASDTEDLVNLTLAVVGTEVAVILVEQASGQVKVSFRSRGKLDCSEMAGQFAGGGHRAAAGATVEGPLLAAQTKVLDAVRAAMR